MEEMIEKVARAICVADGGTPDACPSRVPNWKLYAIQARAAITATNPDERLREALEALLVLWDSYQESDLNQMNAHDCLVRYEVWAKARAALSRKE